MLHKICLLFLLLLPFAGYADRWRSVEVTYRPDPSGYPNSYEITVTTYVKLAPNTIDYQSMGFMFIAPSDYSFADRTNGPLVNGKHMGEMISPTIKKNVYILTRHFIGTGNFVMAMFSGNRELGIINIPDYFRFNLNGVWYGWNNYVLATVNIIDPLASISSPIFTMPPMTDGCIDTKYTINPGVVDPDGDELRFQLIKCQTLIQVNGNYNIGQDIPGYIFPQDVDPKNKSIFTIDPKTGIITWDKPTIAGEYVIAVKVEKWRNNLLLATSMRDMQITISPCSDNRPVINPVPDKCVVAGKSLTYDVTGSDIDKDTLTFTSTGTPYDLTTNPATFIPSASNVGSTSATFNWNTGILQYRKNPYQIFYLIADSHKGTSLSDITSNFITVIAPPIKNITAAVSGRGFNVKWDPSIISQATGYNIYRKTGTATAVFDPCTKGVPANSGYILVGTVNSPSTLSFTDTNNGKGLTSGYTYCYIVTAVFADGDESAPSEPYCAPLMIPFIKIIQDTLTDCQWSTMKMDTSIIQFENADAQTKYKWSSTNDFRITNADSAAALIKLNNYGLHSVKIVAISGAYTDSARIYFNGIAVPKPLIKYKDFDSMPDSVMFYNKSINSSHAEWTLPDGSKSLRFDSVMFVFNKNGYYRVYLKVYNRVDCPDTTSILYRVLFRGVAMPNAFEPENHDIKLSIFRPVAIGLQTYFLGVWDLWGNLIWSSDRLKDAQPADGWDGNDSKGSKMPSQNYIWRMKATFTDGTVWKGIRDKFGKYHTEGTFNLLR